jgi:hypothetical protein
VNWQSACPAAKPRVSGIRVGAVGRESIEVNRGRALCGPVQLGRPVDFPGAHALRVLAGIRADVDAAAATLPRHSTVRVADAVECSEAGTARLCVPVSLRHGTFLGESCYVVTPEGGTAGETR